jgi:hypothetical protein
MEKGFAQHRRGGIKKLAISAGFIVEQIADRPDFGIICVHRAIG